MESALSNKLPVVTSRYFGLINREVTDGCGGVYHGVSGNISSPQQSGSTSLKYPDSTECVWTIEASDGYHIAFNFNGRHGY